MPRFVVLEHNHPMLHWDLMLESGDVLRTWRLVEPLRQGEAIAATAAFDHRLIYLEYEGPVSGGRGRVLRRESGTFAWQVQNADRVEVRLTGQRLRGDLRLKRVEGDNWQAEYLENSLGP